MAPISYLREALRPTPPVLLCVLSDTYVTAGIPVLRILVREGHSRSSSENESLGQVLAEVGTGQLRRPHTRRRPLANLGT